MQYRDFSNFKKLPPPTTAALMSREALVQAYQDLYEQHRQLQEEAESTASAYQVAETYFRQEVYTDDRLSHILNSTSEMILTLNRRHEVTLMNDSCREYFFQAYHVDLKIGDSLDALYDAEERAYWHPKFAAAFEGVSQKAVLQKKVNGATVYLETMLNPVYDQQGAINSISVFCRDVTEDRRKEYAIRENEQHLSEAHQMAMSGSWEYHIPEQKVVLSKETITLFALPEQEEKLELPLEEVLLNYIYPDDLLHFLYKLSVATTYCDQPDQYQDQFEYRFIRPDGALRHLILYAHFKNGQPNVIYGVTRDVTDQKKTEERLIAQNEELSKVNNEIDRFVYRVSHDLRAPIASMLGLINIARTETSREKLMEYLTLQEKSILKMDTFIQEVIDFSKNSRLEIDKKPVNFEQLMKKVVEAQTYEPNIQQVALSYRVQQNEPFISDSNRLYVILNNLVANAVRYANLLQPEPYVKITVNIADNQAMVMVKDNGIGIERQHLKRIFEMFYRANNINPGSGLGLYITQETVHKLRGHIRVTSEVGQGTCFKLTLPNLARLSLET